MAQEPQDTRRARWNLDWRRLREQLLRPEPDPESLQRALAEAARRQAPPLIWLLGNTQSGKTSIIRALTGAERAEIGDGFRPCTRTAQVYDFPAQAPVIRFLDTRGLGEVDYEPAADLAQCEAQSHLLVAVLRVSETRPQDLIEVLRKVRRRQPDWPVVVAQTCLHEGYPAPDDQHVQPYPFEHEDWPARVPPELARLIQAQREAVGALPGDAPVYWVPIDFTLPEDDYQPIDYGLEALWTSLEAAAALGLQARLRSDPNLRSELERAAHPQIVGYSLAAAAAGAVPLADLAAVPALQARLLQVLASLYGVDWNRRVLAEFGALLGGGFALAYGTRLAGRSLAKLIPGWGQTAGALWGASASAGSTYALGKAACLYLQQRKLGRTVPAERLRQAFAEGLIEARQVLGRIGGTQP